MSSATANRETEGGTMKNVINNPETQPQSHTYAEDQSRSNTNQGNRSSGNNEQSRSNQNQGNQAPAASTYGNQESPGGTMKNVIDNPATKPQSHSNMGQGNNRCNANGQDHKPGENSCNNCQKK
jgi:hypothetical protein